MSGPLESIVVTAPTRLHFGLLSFGDRAARQFGGVGMMVDPPLVRLALEPAQQFQVSGPLADRVAEFAKRWHTFYALQEPTPCRITVEEVPPQHVGLGVGTQLALSVAAGLNRLHRRGSPPGAELARSVGRGLRSAVGTYGFCEGGLIVERGKLAGESLSPLDSRLDVPADWRIVLVRPSDFEGLAGDAEHRAFEALPSVPPEVTESLARELREHLLPALAAGDFAAFSASVYRYGRDAGLCFQKVQGGPYHGPQLASLVARIQSLGITGVGQSSWGPTLFAFVKDRVEAERLRLNLQASPPHSAGTLEIMIARPNNVGCVVDSVAR